MYFIIKVITSRLLRSNCFPFSVLYCDSNNLINKDLQYVNRKYRENSYFLYFIKDNSGILLCLLISVLFLIYFCKALGIVTVPLLF